jgi:hypothetical protein
MRGQRYNFGMNMKKWSTLFIATLITFFVTDFIIHGLLLKSTYMATQNLWRPEAEMASFMPYMMLGKAFTALFFALIFVHGYKGKGMGEGIRYGLFLTGLMTGFHLTMYSVEPYPLSLVLAWIGLGAIQYMVAGVVCAKVWGCKSRKA